MTDETAPAPAELRRGPLHDVHTELGATFAPFGGWEMPVAYAGTVAEHTAVRTAVGLFDVSHLGKATVTGPDAVALVNECLTNDLGRIAPGQAQYTLCCTPDGGTADDLIAYLVGPEELFLVPNAANTATVVALLRAAAAARGADVEIVDRHTEYAVLAVQGPRSPAVLSALGLPTDMDYMAFADADHDGRPVRVCRTGYTGEVGFEVLPRWPDAGVVFAALRAEVEACGGEICGLGARDTLRTEMGYPLHGHELGPGLSPLWARTAWAIALDKPAFFGRDALRAEAEAGPRRRLYALRALDRGVLRANLEVRAGGAVIGHTTSGTFSPTLKVGIALALVDTDSGVAKGDEVVVVVRGRELRCEVVVPPLVPAGTR